MTKINFNLRNELALRLSEKNNLFFIKIYRIRSAVYHLYNFNEEIVKNNPIRKADSSVRHVVIIIFMRILDY